MASLFRPDQFYTLISSNGGDVDPFYVRFRPHTYVLAFAALLALACAIALAATPSARADEPSMATGAAEAMPNFTTVFARGSSNLGIQADGSVWGWGSNFDGELADGTWIDRVVPVEIPALAGMRSISMGDTHSLGI